MSGVQDFWQRFLTSQAAGGPAVPQLYDTLRVGADPAAADQGAALIVKGIKTATSSRPEDYADAGTLPFVGALSVVLDGADRPVAVVETTEVVRRRLGELDDAFARDYGEWDGTAETLKAQLAAYYGAEAGSAGDPELICERFHVVYTES